MTPLSKKDQIKKQKKVKTKVVMSLAQLKKKVQRVVNAYVRKRDENEPCISCRKWSETWDAGHYLAMGSNSLLRFEPDNIHKQCISCNRFKHGNLIEYRIQLRKKIGWQRLEDLEEKRHMTKKWTRDELLGIIERFK